MSVLMRYSLFAALICAVSNWDALTIFFLVIASIEMWNKIRRHYRGKNKS